MKTALTVLAILISTSSAFAASKDLRAMNTLLKVGAESEQFMSQVHVGLDDIECAMSNEAHHYDCTMTDISAGEGQGAELKLVGKKAAAVIRVISAYGATTDGGMGKTFFSLKSLRCSQAVEGVEDGSAAERTYCSSEVAQ